MNAGARSATLHDVAREAGVSLATASRTLNGSARKVNDAYRERVQAAAARLGYTPNLSAQAVAKGSTMTVALVVGDISDPYFSSIAAGVISAAEESGFIVTMAVTARDTERELALVRALRGQRPRVLILAGSRMSDEPSQQALVAELTAFESTGGRVVFISQHELPFDTVLLDNYGGGRRLAAALVGLGFRRFAVISGAPSLLTSQDRVVGFLDGLAEHDLTVPADRIVHSEFTRDGGFAGAVELLKRGIDDVELVFAVNDVMAVGAMSALREAGRIPGESIAVAGFDDIPTVRDITPALTTAQIPLMDVGRHAVELALAPRTVGGTEIPVATTVVIRESTPARR